MTNLSSGCSVTLNVYFGCEVIKIRTIWFQTTGPLWLSCFCSSGCAGSRRCFAAADYVEPLTLCRDLLRHRWCFSYETESPNNRQCYICFAAKEDGEVSGLPPPDPTPPYVVINQSGGLEPAVSWQLFNLSLHQTGKRCLDGQEWREFRAFVSCGVTGLLAWSRRPFSHR